MSRCGALFAEDSSARSACCSPALRSSWGPQRAQDKQRIGPACRRPRFSYGINAPLEDVILNDARWKPLAQAVRARHRGRPRAIRHRRQAQDCGSWSPSIAQLDFLEGRYDDALAAAQKLRDLSEKPADKLLSGMRARAQIAAQKKPQFTTSEAYKAEVGGVIAAELAPLP